MKLLDRLLGRAGMHRTTRAQGSEDSTAPSMSRKLSLPQAPAYTYAVGDLHGRFDLYKKLEDHIITEHAKDSAPVLLVLLGDIIDRGPQSAELIEHLCAPPPKGLVRVALMGNHEEMFNRFLSAPERSKDWISWGGEETLASYGIYLDRSLPMEDALRRAWLSGSVNIPKAHRTFFETLPISLTLPDWFFCHASIDPAIALDAQPKSELLWGNPSRLQGRTLEKVIVHGHVIVETPRLEDWEVNLDTGAYKTGCLSAICLRPDAAPTLLQFHDTEDPLNATRPAPTE
ncbi:metallophosphoesterase [Arenibacterium sp. LLYu02]|uniref:metallophosphoesterase n=1 Tax=Arenibacterium sp. LLYu02 TaxID=3404132 RepID=UPI003B216F3C